MQGKNIHNSTLGAFFRHFFHDINGDKVPIHGIHHIFQGNEYIGTLGNIDETKPLCMNREIANYWLILCFFYCPGFLGGFCSTFCFCFLGHGICSLALSGDAQSLLLLSVWLGQPNLFAICLYCSMQDLLYHTLLSIATKVFHVTMEVCKEEYHGESSRDYCLRSIEKEGTTKTLSPMYFLPG